MDFIKVIRSLEELLYEVMTWLVFYPRTMWRIVAHPAATTRYSEDEETQARSRSASSPWSPRPPSSGAGSSPSIARRCAARSSASAT
jgi:hypothetical protein